MFHKILVALDGSEFSELALQPAFDIAEKFGAEILLLRVITVEVMAAMGAAPDYSYELQNLHERYEREAAMTYLQSIRARWQGTGLAVRTQVMIGAPPAVILGLVAEYNIDLIVMSTHGRTGIRRLLYGSVAEAVVRGTHLPVLLVPLS